MAVMLILEALSHLRVVVVSYFAGGNLSVA